MGHFLPSPLFSLTMCRLRNWSPKPQVAEQGVQSVQSDTKQSLAGNKVLIRIAKAKYIYLLTERSKMHCLNQLGFIHSKCKIVALIDGVISRFGGPLLVLLPPYTT